MGDPIKQSDLESFALRIERHMERECEAVRREVTLSIDALTDRMDKQNGRVSKLEDRSLELEKGVVKRQAQIEALEEKDLWSLVPTKGKVMIGLAAIAFLGDFTSHVPFEMLWKFIEAVI